MSLLSGTKDTPAWGSKMKVNSTDSGAPWVSGVKDLACILRAAVS